MTTGKLLDHWQPPAWAGRPVALVATSFTFDTDFFETSCLGRFLGLDTQRGEGDPLMAVIEEEERLAEVRAAVIVDRSERPEGRNLRWDVLTVAQARGLQHAKATLLVWERLVRVIVGSANLTPAGYRSNVEVATLFDAFDEGPVPKPFMLSLLAEMREIASAAAGAADRQGPKQRVLETIADAERRLGDWALPSAWTGNLRAAVAPSRPGASPFRQFDAVWAGSRPRAAAVLSPFFDTEPGGSVAAERLSELMAQRGRASVRFCLPGDVQATGVIVRAPSTVAARLPARIGRSFELFRPPDDEPRRLHAKALVISSDEWVAALAGSSNFTVGGLGLAAGSGHVELNVWFGAAIGTPEAEQLVALVPDGDPIDPEAATWEPEPDDDTPTGPTLPAGFVDCLLDPRPTRLTLTFTLDTAELPDEWQLRLPGSALISRAEWESLGHPEEVSLPAPAGPPPFFVDVTWADAEGMQSAPWAVNVTDPGALPPPDELRTLPADALLAALASTRPLHEAVVIALQREARARSQGTIDLDPLKRHTTDGLFRRTGRLSAALTGLQDRLERPVTNLDALCWRLRGPFGPLRLAEQMLNEATAAGRLQGEAAFGIAELALTLARTEWSRAATPAVPLAALQREANDVITELARLITTTEMPADLRGYVRLAMREARR
jgi:hypothetical protein